MASDYNRLRDIVTGLTIFLSHGGDHAEPSYDQINSGQADGEALSSEEIRSLKAAGWSNVSEFCECENVTEDDEGDEVGHESTCNQWMIYT